MSRSLGPGLIGPVGKRTCPCLIRPTPQLSASLTLLPDASHNPAGGAEYLDIPAGAVLRNDMLSEDQVPMLGSAQGLGACLGCQYGWVVGMELETANTRKCEVVRVATQPTWPHLTQFRARVCFHLLRLELTQRMQETLEEIGADWVLFRPQATHSNRARHPGSWPVSCPPRLYPARAHEGI